MRKIVLSLAVSLDGYIEGPNGEYDWCFTDQDYGMSEFFNRIDAVFLGRKSWELTQTMTDPVPGMPPMKEYIFSNTLKEVKPGQILISGDIAKAVNEIRNSEGKDIWLFGGASLTRSLMELNLIDEISLAIHPILLGAGKLLFPQISHRIPLQLTDCKSFNTGLVILTYSRDV